MHRPGLQGQAPPQVLHIGAQALAAHGAKEVFQRLITEVEVVVAQGEIVQPHGVEGRRHRVEGPIGPVLQIVLHQRRALQRIAAVQHQGVAVLFDLGGHIQQSGSLGAVRGVIHREDVAVGIGSEVNFETLFHPYPLASLTRILVESHSTMSTSTMSPARIAPASSQR